MALSDTHTYPKQIVKLGVFGHTADFVFRSGRGDKE